MKKIALLFIAVFAASLLFAQPKWAIKASGTIGGSINSGTYTYYDDGYGYHHGRWDDIYDNSELFYEAGLGFRVYALKWLYFGADLNYSQIKNKYDSFYLREGGLSWYSPTLTLDGLGLSFVSGFTFPNKSRFYPFAEIGLMPFFAFNDDFHDKNVYFGTNFKLGGGFKLTNKLAIELAVTSTTLYRFDNSYDYYYGGYHYYSDYSVELNGGIGANLGLVIIL
ncbi:MAG: hypothetical protein LBG19_11715 [Prevotellaceae bacterium]|jgi:hypothetical protein|nr:hypothetical protein [Prevotellaceae bacterium]